MLKGGLLLLVWFGESIRPTRDADLLGFGDLSSEAIAKILAEVCALEVEPDALTYDASSILVTAIRPDDDYGGCRATLRARLGPACLRVQVDVGIGDAVTPEPEWLEYPSLLDFPRPRLRAYRPETMIAEKLHALVTLGMQNSRMRDLFDIYALAERRSFDGSCLLQAVRATFERRRTEIPRELPLALTPAFAGDAAKRAQWRSFLRKNALSKAPEDLREVIESIAGFLGPVLEAAQQRIEAPCIWPPGGPWQ